MVNLPHIDICEANGMTTSNMKDHVLLRDIVTPIKQALNPTHNNKKLSAFNGGLTTPSLKQYKQIRTAINSAFQIDSEPEFDDKKFDEGTLTLMDLSLIFHYHAHSRNLDALPMNTRINKKNRMEWRNALLSHLDELACTPN